MYCKQCGYEIQNDDKFCKNCGVPIQSSVMITQNKDLVSQQTIVEHLENAGILEKRIYELNMLIQNLANKIACLRTKNKVSNAYYEPLSYWHFLLIFPIIWIIVSLKLIFSNEEMPIIAIILFYRSIMPYYKTAAIAASVCTLIPAAVYFVIAIIINICRKIQHTNEIKQNEIKYSDSLKKADILETEQKDLIQKRSQAQKYLQMVYDKNILFPKYRNMIAVLTIHEYFISGRCDTLKGHEGAYNIYEGELRQNIIINSLEAIQYSLEQIKRNQYMLYQALQDAQNRIDSLSYEFGNISSSMSNIEQNSKISAYNSKIASDNARILSYIELAKY